MADVNVQIKNRNGSVWDKLYPKTKAELVETSTTQQFASDTEKAAWNAKQAALGFTPEDSANKGVANGYAGLDESGTIPTSQLPGSVDEILEYVNLAAFPASGEASKIYVAQDVNLTYRWTGSAYVEISKSVAIGELSTTAYRGDRGKTAYEHSQVAHAPSTAQKNSDITKAEIEAKLTGELTSHTHAETYVHPTTAGYKHIPAGGAVGNLIKYSAAGTGVWGDIITVSASEPSTPSTNDLWCEVV